METIGSQDIGPDESVSQFNNDLKSVATIASVSASSNSVSVLGHRIRGLPSEDRYMVMNKDEITVARMRSILPICLLEDCSNYRKIFKLNGT